MRGAVYRWLLDRVLGAFARLHVDTAARLGAALGHVVFHLGLRRRVVSDNLRRCLDLHGAVRRQIAAKSYAHLGATFIEMWSEHPAFRTTVANPLHLQRLVADGRGLVVVTAHIGSWEAGGTALHGSGRRVLAYAKRQHDSAFDERLHRRRQAFGIEVLYVADGDRRAASDSARALRSGAVLMLPADQSPPRGEGVEGWLFGVPTRLHAGPAVLARLGRARLVPAVCLRTAPGRTMTWFGREITAGADDDATVQAVMDALTGVIARHPQQYFWHHRRFKRPGTREPRSWRPRRGHL